MLFVAIAMSALAGTSPAQIRDTLTQPKPSVKSLTQGSEIMESALVESYSLAMEFQPEERMRHLMSLCSAASEARSLAARQREWTEELFRVAGELPSGDALRTRGQSAAVSCMASVNPKRALQIFDALEPPAKADTDPRPWVARVAFAKMLEQQGAKAIPTLRQRARKLGDTGPYPYSAMMPVIAKLKGQPDKAQHIFRDALGYFRQSKDPVSAI